MKTKIDGLIPIEKIIADTKNLLDEANWKIEIDDNIHNIPRDTKIKVQTRALIMANAPDILLGDHFEAVVILGCEELGNNWFSKYGYIKMYYDLDGNFVTEDRYPPCCRGCR